MAHLKMDPQLVPIAQLSTAYVADVPHSFVLIGLVPFPAIEGGKSHITLVTGNILQWTVVVGHSGFIRE